MFKVWKFGTGFLGANFWSRDFFGFGWKPLRFLGGFVPLFDNLVPDREKLPGDEVAHSIIPGNPEYPPSF